MMRKIVLALSLVLTFSGVAAAQLPRSRGPADPRYFPDLYKGPAWGMTLSEYYTYGNKADGSFGYAQHGYREGSNDDILRWKQATGTAVPPGYYLQRWRSRNELPAASPAQQAPRVLQPVHRSEALEPKTLAPVTAKGARQTLPSGQPLLFGESSSLKAEQNVAAGSPPTADRSTRRNAQTRGIAKETSTQPVRLTPPEQRDAGLHGEQKNEGNGAADGTEWDDKN